MNKRLADAAFLAGDEYTIADIATFPWTRSFKNQGIELTDFPHVQRWFDEISARPAVQRGVEVLAHLRKPLTNPKALETLFGSTQYDNR
jgi:GST-like protein